MPIILLFLVIIGAFLAGNSVVNRQVKPAVIEETKIETPTPSPSFTPTPTPVSQVKGSQIAPTLFDPIVDCVSDWQKQQGQTNKAKKSMCDSWIDCQMGFGVAVRVPKEKCDALINCQIGDKVIKVSSNEECEKYKARIPQQGNTVNCQTQSGWVRMTQDDCTKAQNAWGNQILDNAKQQEKENQDIINAFRSIENEIWQASTLDQLDNIRERLRQLPQAPDPSIQNYIGTLIRLIEERIKILQKQ